MSAESERRIYTRAGRTYFVVTNALSLLAVALGLAIALGCMLLLFALLALALEKLGAKLTRPA